MGTDIPSCWQDAPAQSVGGDSWRAYWEDMSDDQQVFRIEAGDYARRAIRLLQPHRSMRVLDFGCGFGHTARELAPAVGTIALWDASSAVRRQARQRVSGIPNVELLDMSSAEALTRIGEFDLILVHSVLQYMSEDEVRGWLSRWREWLKPDARLVVSDLAIPGASALKELLTYLLFAARHGFFCNALMSGVRELSHYWQARNSRPLTVIGRQTLESWARDAGLSVEWLHENLSHRQSRACAVLRRAQ
jgi:cyclopropane fatty-acyl-phospholipid synthase-like methyltransferase